MVLVSHTWAGSIQISAYGNATKSIDVALNKSSSNSSIRRLVNSDDRENQDNERRGLHFSGTGRAMGGGNPLEGLLSKPIGYRSSSHRESHKTPKYIVYPSASQSVLPESQNGEIDSELERQISLYDIFSAVAMDRFAPGEAYGGTVYKIVKAREQKNKNGYQYQKPSGK